MIWTRTHTTIMGVAACAMAGVVAAVVMLTPTRDAVARTGGPAVSIAVVDPREPVVTPGGVMDVGEVVDGYEHRPVAQPASHDFVSSEDDWDEPLPLPEPRRWRSEPELEPEPTPEARVIVSAPQPHRDRDRDRFGFDEPQPDYAAQRRERRARMERMEEAQRQARGVEPTDDSVFY